MHLRPSRQLVQGGEHVSEAETRLADLYQHQAPRLYTYLRNHLASSADAEDLLLDVFLAALERQADLQTLPEENLRAWLWTVARNKMINHYRKSQRQQNVPLETLAEAMDETWLPERHLLHREESDQLRHFLQGLSTSQREALELRFLGGLRSKEIAVLLHKREGAVRTLLSRAVNALREMYTH